MAILLTNEDAREYSQIQGFATLTLISALKLYDKHKIRVNKAYAPKAMMNTARRITGRTFSARDYKGAIAALKATLPIELQHKV